MNDECPLCKGTGKFEFPKSIEIDSAKVKATIAKELRAKGYGIRQIMRGLGYKSPRSISKILKELA